MKLLKQVILNPGEQIQMKITGNETTMVIQIWETDNTQEAIIIEHEHRKN